jgi:peptide/nickel transport system ATP-binding protein
MQETPLLSVKDLKVYFPVLRGIRKKKVADIKAVDGVSFDIWRGETFGLVGESGCGKSTIARTLLRLSEATAGDIRFDGVNVASTDVKALRKIRRSMSMIFQDPFGSLDPRWRAADIVIEPLRNSGTHIAGAEIDKRIDELFDLVGLDRTYRERVPHEFSGGQRQRLAIARALSTNPRFIVCDEAISSLDVSIQAQIINLLEELQQRLELTYLFIAHDMSMVRHISDRVAVMYLGQLVEIGDWETLFDKPLHPYTQALLEAVPIPDPAAERQRKKRIIKGEVPSPMQRPAGCAFSTRCPYVMPLCRCTMPELCTQSPTHRVACHLMEDCK